MMTDDEREMGVESAEKRAHHNALERKRRDHIKDSFSSLRDSVPSLHGEKVASRALILKKAADYIQYMRKKNTAHQEDIADLKRQNSLLEAQIRILEKNRPVGAYSPLTDDESDVGDASSSLSEDQDNNDIRLGKDVKFNADGL